MTRVMREYPDYPDEWMEEGHPNAEFWKSDPLYWQANLDYHTAEWAKVEAQRYAWLDVWWKEGHTGDMMNEVGYLRLRVTGECHRTGILASRLRLCELGCPE